MRSKVAAGQAMVVRWHWSQSKFVLVSQRLRILTAGACIPGSSPGEGQAVA